MTDTTTMTPPIDAFALTPPAPVAAVQADKLAGLVPVEDEKKSVLDKKVDDFVNRLIATSASSPEFG